MYIELVSDKFDRDIKPRSLIAHVTRVLRVPGDRCGILYKKLLVMAKGIDIELRVIPLTVFPLPQDLQ